MADDSDFLKRLFNVFDPARPLPAGDQAYVDCNEVRGDGDILVGIGREILRSDQMTCQLYGGHRGAGKSTELLRLQNDLEQKNCFVVYFAADEEDIEPEDAQYTDILLACTRRLLEKLKDSASPAPLLNWLDNRWQELKELAFTNLSFEKLGVEAQIAQFAKITATLRTEPTQRHKIRERINPHTITLIEALNKFIKDAKNKLPSGNSQLVIIADNLDRIVPIPQEDGRTNHEQIFLDRSEQLKALDCHLVYTVPISILYSRRAADVANTYGTPQVLPMVMVKTPENTIYQPGIDKFTEVLQRRLSRINNNHAILGIFNQPEDLQQLCLMSGGHMRNLLLLMKQAIKYTDTLPIPTRAVHRSVGDLRNTYRNTVYADEWQALAKVHHFKQIENNEMDRRLLFNRCILQYSNFNTVGESQSWYDIHPLIKGIKEFQDSYNQLYPS